MDPSPQTDTFMYFNTLTSPIGFTPAHEDQIVEWHRRNSEKCFLVKEYTEAGAPHYHSIIACKSPKKACHVTDKLVRLYGQMMIEYTKGVTVKVKSVSDFIGLLHYHSKDLKGPPILVTGWRMSWIKQQCEANVKKIPHKMLSKNVYMVQFSTSVSLVIEYAKACGHPLTGMDSFITVVTEMQAKGYQFEKIKPKWLYGQVMAMTGNSECARRLWEDALFSLR